MITTLSILAAALVDFGGIRFGSAPDALATADAHARPIAVHNAQFRDIFEADKLIAGEQGKGHWYYVANRLVEGNLQIAKSPADWNDCRRPFEVSLAAISGKYGAVGERTDFRPGEHRVLEVFAAQWRDL